MRAVDQRVLMRGLQKHIGHRAAARLTWWADRNVAGWTGACGAVRGGGDHGDVLAAAPL